MKEIFTVIVVIGSLFSLHRNMRWFWICTAIASTFFWVCAMITGQIIETILLMSNAGIAVFGYLNELYPRSGINYYDRTKFPEKRTWND
jgi:hypothetical protein